MMTHLNRGHGGMPLAATAGSDPPFNDDLLRGAVEIAAFLFKGDPMKHRRKVYHLIETSRMPRFYMGSMVCARKSTLLNWIAAQETRGMRNAKGPKADETDEDTAHADDAKPMGKPDDKESE